MASLLRRRTRKTTFAIFSGYDMSRQTFIDMVNQMPALRAELEDDALDSLVSEYDGWRMQHKAPQLMHLYESECDDDLPDEPYAAVTSFFVPTRYIDYTDESQLEDAENAPFAQETEKDKAVLAKFLRCVQDHGSFQFDTTKIRFRWVQDYHPYYSIVKGTWIPEPYRARKTEFAIFSGYDMSREAFTDMVTHMPALNSQLEEPYDMENLVSAYKGWRTRHKANLIMLLYEGDDEDEEEEDLPDETYAAVSSFFVPTRYIDYTDESQLEDAENAPFAQETEKDKAAFAHFLRCVQDHGGLQLDPAKLKFRWVRDYHPFYCITTGTWSG